MLSTGLHSMFKTMLHPFHGSELYSQQYTAMCFIPCEPLKINILFIALCFDSDHWTKSHVRHSVSSTTNTKLNPMHGTVFHPLNNTRLNSMHRNMFRPLQTTSSYPVHINVQYNISPSKIPPLILDSAVWTMHAEPFYHLYAQFYAKSREKHNNKTQACRKFTALSQDLWVALFHFTPNHVSH